MSKKLISKYIFTPGTPGTVKVPGKVALENIVLITNVATNSVIYNMFESTLGGTATYNPSDTTTFPTGINGVTTISLPTSTAGMSGANALQIIVDDKQLITRPWDFGTDAIERPRMAAPQSLIDADFEYGLQPTKWQNFQTARQYPGIFEQPGTDLAITSMTSDGNNPSLISITTVAAHTLTAGNAITMVGVNKTITGFSGCEGSFLVAATPAPGSTTFSYYARTQVGTGTSNMLTDATVLRKGGFYSGAALTLSSISSDGGAPSNITVTTASTHGLVPGQGIMVDVTSAGTGHEQAEGPFFVSQVISPTSFLYVARAGAVVTTGTTLTATIYNRTDGFFVHRPFDGGVLVGSNCPTYGTQAVRASKKYFRYQSGKGFFFNTGTVMRPNYDIQSITSSGTSAGSTITVTTDGVDHGLQVGAVVRIEGIVTSGYNNTYAVASILNDTSFTVLALTGLGDTTGTLAVSPKIFVISWWGSAVRLGMFDDQNGIFWEYNGQELAVCVRNSIIQLAGQVSINAGSNSLGGNNTRFQDQLKVGDQIVIRGMTHEVTSITSQTALTVAPNFRGVANVAGVRACLVTTTRIPQSQFNLDTIDGTGPSGYSIDLNKMQMLGMQYTWYGAGFIDFMLRGPDGNFIFVHRFKNNNVNNEAYMRSGNLPARYSISNDTGVNKLATGIGASDNTLTLTDASKFPPNGTIYIDNEIITYTGKSTNTLTGCVRAATHSHYIGGTTRSFTAAAAATHAANAGVILLSTTASPTLSHWGSAIIMDGLYDQDRGYIFNYARTSISATTSPQTVFMIRLAPSVSNATVGDLGSRDLLNRSQLLLTGIEVTGGSLNPLIIEAVLNPYNYPTNTASVTWFPLTPSAAGGLPSLCQITTTNPTWNSTPQYALPGETVFSFIADGAGTKTLDLTPLKELTASPLGGTGAFPNGSDILCVNVRTITGSSTVHVLLRWSEAQA